MDPLIFGLFNEVVLNRDMIQHGMKGEDDTTVSRYIGIYIRGGDLFSGTVLALGWLN
jgi:hypothetical protein